MTAFDKCLVCGGELVEKSVEKLLRGGRHTAAMTVYADVCQRCGERLYTVETIERFEQVRKMLERQEVAGFELTGQAYKVG